ncbi:MAG: hypothetical protein JW915_23245 [Chitinispirillaceae bacterium]|nr:hypothetical protein [Chitinispirillaceae bacterium]
MPKVYRISFLGFVISALSAVTAIAQSDGDALQLQTFVIESGADKPDVTDGLIANPVNLDDWKSAYARKITFEAAGVGTRTGTILFTNDNDSFYMSLALPNDNNGANQGFFIYFDLDNNGVLDGTPSQLGEYAVRCVKLDATQAILTEYGWNGTQWIENTIATPGLEQGFADNGSGGSHVYNFEIRIPFLSNPPNAGQAYFGTEPGNELGVMITLDLQAGAFYWQSAGTSITNTSQWGELMINTAMASPRQIASLFAKTRIPDVSDGNISDDPNWNYAFDKTVVFTDFAGNKLTNCRILTKEAGGNLYFGAKITDNVSNNGDYLQIYFDQGANGGEMNYVLNSSASSRKDDAIRVAGNDALGDLNFDGSSWISDGVINLTGAANFITGTAWEFELAKPLTTADGNDLSITSGDKVGILFRYYDADNSRDYWWSSTINSDFNKVDVSTTYNALGWGELATGGPFVQPLCPEQNDVISGTYPFMIYAEDESGVADIDSVDYRITDLNDNIFIDFSSVTRLTKIDNTSSGLWVTTFNSNTGTTPDGDYNVVFRVKDDDGISVKSPVRIRIQNTGSVGGPSISDVSLKTGDLIAGSYRLTFNVSPSSSYLLVSDSIEISIDGRNWTKVDSTPSATGGNARDSIGTTNLNDGVHTIRLRAKDNGGLAWGYSDLIIFNVKNEGTAPVITITSPADSLEKSGSLSIGFSVALQAGRSIDSCQISVDGFNWVRTTTNTTHLINTGHYTDGTHIIQIRAFDNSGRVGYSNSAAFVFKNSPTVTLTAPRPDSVVSGTLIVTFTSTAIAPATIASSQISIDGGTWRATSTGTLDTLNTQTLTEGSHTIQIRATDSNNKTGISGIRKFVVRNNPSVILVSPKADTVLQGTVTVNFNAAAVAPAFITRRNIYIDGTLVDTSTTEDAWQWNTVHYNDGQHTIQVRIIDSDGKASTSELVSVTLANTPIVRILSPSDTMELSGVDTIKFNVSYAPGTTRDTTEIAFNGGTWIPTSGPFSHVWVTTDFLDGNHTIQIRARGTNGKVGYSQVSSFKISNAPSVTILAPTGGEAISGDYLVRFSIKPVAPAIITRRSISIDGNPWSDNLVDSASFLLRTMGWETGTHSIKVRAFDNRGRIGYSGERSLVVDNNAPLTSAPKAEYNEASLTAKSGSDVLVTVLVKDNLVGLRTDSAVILSSASINSSGSVTYVMLDNGNSGDKVAGDNIFSALVKVSTDSTGTIGYSIRSIDRLGNDTTIFSAINLDNIAPVTHYTLDPVPESGINKLNGKTFFRRLVMKGSYGDKGGSGLSRAFISVKNDSGLHVNTSPVNLDSEDSLFSRVIDLIPGRNILMLYAIDKAGNVDSTISEVVYYEPKATKTINREGGMVLNPDGSSVTVSKDALLGPVEITIVPVEPIEQRKPLNKNVTLINVAHDFGPDGTTFRKPVLVTLSYTEADLDLNQDSKQDVDPRKLTVVFWDGGTWRAAGPSSVDTAKHTVSVSVNHFTIFDLAIFNAPVSSELVAFWTANPLKHGKGTYFTYNVPEAGTVSLKILDMAGDLVYQLIPAKTPALPGPTPVSVEWRGQNVAERFAGVGLYVYLFTYTSNSTNKTTVIRKPIGVLK